MHFTSKHLFLVGMVLRMVLFLYGIYQDKYLQVKYTDIDYLVFSDAARFVYDGLSPYRRETYRYTPLLAWMLVPNSWGGVFVHYGKLLFIVCDMLTGLLILRSLSRSSTGLSNKKKLILSSLWILNPMVATISTRGSSESILTFIIMLSVDHYLSGRYNEAAFWLGLSIHFKIYPIIYLPAFMYHMASQNTPIVIFKSIPILKWLNKTNIKFFLVTVASLMIWTILMYHVYGYEFLDHSYLYHLTRLDHRHNFALYNSVLYYKSANIFPNTSSERNNLSYLGLLTDSIENFAFVPQLFFSAILIPLLLARKDIVACLFVQTFTFVTFNKVMTSQYFVWFLIFLPHFLAGSRLSRSIYATRGVSMIILWIASQACWLMFAYRLEFLGQSTFNVGLLYSSVFFYITNCWMIGQFIEHF